MTIREWNLANGIKVSIEDYDLLSFMWHRAGRGYASGSVVKEGYPRALKGPTYLHHLVALRLWPDYKETGLQVDHINNNKLDNTRGNLRLVTHSLNNFKKPLSKYGGIEQLPDGCYKAILKLHGKRIRGKPRRNIDDALRDRLEIELKYHGEYAPRESTVTQKNPNN
jgi:hypothetical protein